MSDHSNGNTTAPVKMCAHWDCRNACVLECARCRLVSYCGQEHQAQSHQHHKLVCGKPDALDGWAVAAAVYKALEYWDARLDLVCYHACWLELRTEEGGVGNTVTFGLRPQLEPTHRIDCLRDFEATDKKASERSKAEQKQRAMVYWAMRCMNLGCTANYLTHEVLCLARTQGYKFLVFGANAALSLESEPSLEMLRVEPRHKLIVKGLNKEPQRTPDAMGHWVVALGSHVVDLTAGRFWLFRNPSDGSVHDVRPLCVCDKYDYSIAVGRAGPVHGEQKDGTRLDLGAMLRAELAQRQYWVPARGIVQVTLADYFTRQCAEAGTPEAETNRQIAQKETDELLEWLNAQQERLSQLTMDGPAELVDTQKQCVESEEAGMINLKYYVDRTVKK